MYMYIHKPQINTILLGFLSILDSNMHIIIMLCIYSVYMCTIHAIW